MTTKNIEEQIQQTVDRAGVIIDENGVLRDVFRLPFNATGAGNNVAVGAQGAGIRVRVIGAAVVAKGACDVKFTDAGGDISATFGLAANGGLVLPREPLGWIQTGPNSPLNVNLSIATQVGVQLLWCQAS